MPAPRMPRMKLNRQLCEAVLGMSQYLEMIPPYASMRQAADHAMQDGGPRIRVLTERGGTERALLRIAGCRFYPVPHQARNQLTLRRKSSIPHLRSIVTLYSEFSRVDNCSPA